MTRPATVQFDVNPSGAGRLAAGVLILVAMMVSAALEKGALSFFGAPATDAGKIAAATERIDPNHATFASLVRLAGIGPVRAGKILQYRAEATSPAFGRPEDLEKIHGIGPGTVKKVAPFLSFFPRPQP